MPAFMSGFNSGASVVEHGLARRDRLAAQDFDRSYRERVLVGEEASRALNQRISERKLSEEIKNQVALDAALERYHAKTQTMDPVTQQPLYTSIQAYEDEVLPVVARIKPDALESHFQHKALAENTAALRTIQLQNAENRATQIAKGTATTPALTVTAKDYAAYQAALESGDETAQEVYGRKLGIVGLRAEDKLLLSALIKGQLNSLDALIDPEGLAPKIKKLIETYGRGTGRGMVVPPPDSSVTPTAPPAPSASPPKRYNPATRKLE